MAEVIIDVIAKDNFTGVLGNFGSIMTGIESVINLATSAFRAFTDFAGQGLEAVSAYERLGLALETMAAREALVTGEAKTMAEALEVTAGQSEVLLQWMQELAIKSPFTLEGVANAFRLAQAYGFTADEAKRLTQAMIDFAAGTGATEDTMSRIALALGQMEAKGKVAGQEMLQLVNAGLPALGILADGFGVTTAEMQKMISDGAVPAKEAIEIITEYLETNFAGAAERQAESWAGLTGTFQDLKQMGLREFFGELFDALQPLAVELSAFLQGPGLEMIGVIGEILGELAATIFERFAGFSESPFMQWLNEVIENSTVVTETFKTIESSLKGVGTFDWSVKIGTEVDTDLLIANIKEAIIPALESIPGEIQKWIDSGGADELSQKIITWIENAGGGEGVASAAISMADDIALALLNALNAINWEEIGIAIDKKIAEIISGIDWTKSGEALSSSISSIFSEATSQVSEEGFFVAVSKLLEKLNPVLGFLKTETAKAVDKALTDFFAGVFTEFNAWGQDMSDKVSKWATGLGNDIESAFKSGLGSAFSDIGKWVMGAFNDIGRAAIDGLVGGIYAYGSQILTPFNTLIKSVKSLFGIASASTVFYQIGRDIMAGLGGGLASLLSWLLSVVTTIVTTILAPFAPILELLGIDLGSIGGGTTPAPTTPSPGTPSTGVVNNYFYGTVYFMGGEEPGSYYNCPSPNPIMDATSKTLVAPGF